MSYIDKLTQKLYDQSTSGWFGQKMNDIIGDDYQKHLLNMSVGGGSPTLGYGQDFRDAENEGESGWGRVGQNAGRSAAILASIFGGAAALGGEGAAGAGGGGTAAGAGGGGGGAVGTLYPGSTGGGSALNSAGMLDYGAMGSGGSGGTAAGGGINWMQLGSKAMGAMSNSSNSGQQGQSQGGYTANGMPDLSQPAFIQQPEYQNQVYSIAPNQNQGLNQGLMGLRSNGY